MATVDAGNVVVVAFKPAEEPDGGYVLRLVELEGRETPIEVDISVFQPMQAFETTLIETDRVPAPLKAGKIVSAIAANEMKTFRFVPNPTARPDSS